MVFQSITRLAVPLTVAVHAFKKPFVYAGFISLNTDGHEEMRFHAFGFGMINGSPSQIAFQGAEGFCHEPQLHVTTPEQFGVVGTQVGAQEVTALALAHRGPA